MEELLTVEEVADRLRVSKAAVYRWVNEKRLVPQRAGSRLRFTEAGILAFLEQSNRSRRSRNEVRLGS